MAGLIVSTIAYFFAAYLIKRRLEDMDIPKSVTRSLVIFVGAAIVAYGVNYAVDRMIG